MRPRLISRGNDLRTVFLNRAWARFNEAATDQSRKSHGVIASRSDQRCFNEAATDQSRKYHGRRAHAVADSCFNEAATDQSRKWIFEGRRTRAWPASMRPRLISRGNSLPRTLLYFQGPASHAAS